MERASYLKKIRRLIVVEAVLVAVLAFTISARQQSIQTNAVVGRQPVAVNTEESSSEENSTEQSGETETTPTEETIKWVDFTVSYEALCAAYGWDVDTHGTEHEVHWIELLAYTAAKTGGSFDKEALELLNETASSVSEGEKDLDELGADLKYYPYYKNAYTAVLGGMVGEFEEEYIDENGKASYQKRYGLKAYFPLAKGFDYNHYDDFGAGRSYGYKRKHLGHDMMGQTGTPIRIICRI